MSGALARFAKNAALIAICSVGAGCAPPEPVSLVSPHGEESIQELRGEALGTTGMVKWKGSPGADLKPVVDAALADVDAKMSTWRDDSELSAIRAAEGPVDVSAETVFVVREALVLAEATGGAFDPTVQPLVELWGFHGERRTTAPTDEELKAARDQVGWEKVVVTATTVDSGGTALDLSAIAKGHAVDRVSQALSAVHLADHLVEVGGEVRAMGSGSAGPWRLGVDRPEEGLAPGQQLAAIAGLTNVGMATSGNYRNTYEIDGQRVVHTLDPRTGKPALGKVASATVVAPDCRTADGWATALMVLGPEQGLKLVEARPDIDALLLIVGPDGRFDHVQSSKMGSWLRDD